MIRISFIFQVNKESSIKVLAQARAVDAYGAEGLEIKLSGNPELVNQVQLDRSIMDLIEEETIEHLLNKKHFDELKF
jgi:DNA-binding protein YbaB